MDFPPLIIRHDIELSVSKTNFSFLKHLFCWYEENEFSYYLYKRIAYQIQVPTNDKERRYLCFNQAYQYLFKHAQESDEQIIIKTFFQTLFDRNNVLTDDLTFTFMGKRLINVTKTGTFDVPSMSFSYDASGKRLSKTVNSVIHQYYYDGDKLVYEAETEVSSSILLHEKKFFYDENGVLTFMELDGVRYFYYIDATHMVRGLFNSDGEFIVRYSYDAWGNVTDIIDYSSISLSTLNPFLFKCYYYDHESKWYYCLSRYYVPLWMRWLSIDDSSYLTSEIPAGYNLYVYCNNNPVMYLDSTGHSWESFWNGVGNWFVEHKNELIIGAAFIVAGILTMGAAAAVGDATFGGVMAAMGSAAISSAVQVGISMGISATIGGAISATSGDGFWSGFSDGLASGFMWGGIFAGTAQVLSGAMSITRSLAPNFNGSKIGNTKLWSPNAASNSNIGGTLIKFGNYNRFDVETVRMLHVAWKIFGSKINHIPFGTITAGIIGGF